MMRFSNRVAVMIRRGFLTPQGCSLPQLTAASGVIEITLFVCRELGGSTVRKSAQEYKPTILLCKVHSTKCRFDVIYSSLAPSFFEK